MAGGKVSELNYKELTYRLDYNPETGEFRWKNPLTNRVKCGDLAGTFDLYGYKLIGIKGYQYKAHRLAWFYVTGKWPDSEIDHINGIKDDNRLCNLRLSGKNGNRQNVGITLNNTSGEKGVSFTKIFKKWRAYAERDGKRLHSYHKHWWQAVRAARKYRKELHGEYHRHK